MGGAKGAVEGRQTVEAASIGDIGNSPLRPMKQEVQHALQPETGQRAGKRKAGGLEQDMQRARRHAEFARDEEWGEIGTAKIAPQAENRAVNGRR